MRILVTGVTGYAGYYTAIAFRQAGYQGEIEFAPPSEDDETSTWFDQNEFITSGKIRRWLGWYPRHTGLIDEIESYYSAWKAAN